MAIPSPLPVSVCMIAGAEEARIGRALRSVAGWAGEIVVVLNEDVGDDTETIARSFGARVFREPWRGHVAQKNSAAAKATQDWLLGLDADEEVTAALAAETAAMLGGAGPPRDVLAFSMPRCSLYCGRWLRHGDWYPDRKVRLWRRGRAAWGGTDPHDKLQVEGRVGRLRGDLRHYSMRDIEDHVRKAVAYGSLFASQYPADGPRVGLFELWARPAWRFFRSYLLRLGFLDGWPGYAVARLIAFEAFIRYAKVRERQRGAPADAHPKP
jgi:glycosyltransferase involved in cell wall biosynthesis